MYNAEQKWRADGLKAVMSLEILGIRIEYTKEVDGITSYYYSVPESSTFATDDENLKGRIETANGLKTLAKEVITDLVVSTCEMFGDPKLIDEFKEYVASHVKFYAKVRNGEVWSNEHGEARVKELTEELRQAIEYTEV